RSSDLALHAAARRDHLRLLRPAEVADARLRDARLRARRRCRGEPRQGGHPSAGRDRRRVLGDRAPRQGVRLRRLDDGEAQGADPAAAVRGADPGRRRQPHHRPRDRARAAQGRARQVLRRRHQPQAQAAREAEGGQEADEEHRPRRGAPGGVRRRAVLRCRRRQGDREEVSGAGVPGAAATPFGVYLHVPFCSVRCGYCDFNTYTATELGGGASQTSYAATAIAEIALADAELVRRGLAGRPVETVFFGGGTPTLLPTADLAAMLAAVTSTWGLAADAEVTTEANPDSVGPEDLVALREAGFTRVSFGMQSAVPHVLATLDRTHDP